MDDPSLVVSLIIGGVEGGKSINNEALFLRFSPTRDPLPMVLEDIDPYTYFLSNPPFHDVELGESPLVVYPSPYQGWSVPNSYLLISKGPIK